MFCINLESAMLSVNLNQLRLVKITYPPTGHMLVFTQCLFDIRGPKTPPSEHAKATVFWAWIPWRSFQFSFLCRMMIISFSYLQIPLFLLSTPQFYPVNCWILFLQGGSSRFVLLSPHLAALWIRSFSTANLDVFSVWLALHLTKKQVG